ncbi:hypothetical protein GmHk_09G027080 [Glycine max]|nr:hypothetical protein GmHk_09G027080 [Glycine max]
MTLQLLIFQVFSPFHSGGPIAKELIPKLTVVRRNLSSKLGVAILDINVQPVITSTILLMRVGGILFVLGSTFGSYLLFLYLGLSTPILYDFYKYRSNIPEYYLLLNDFIQLCANYFYFLCFYMMILPSTTLCGVLLFFYKDEVLDYQKANQEEDLKSKDNLEIRKRYG